MRGSDQTGTSSEYLQKSNQRFQRHFKWSTKMVRLATLTHYRPAMPFGNRK